MQLSMVAIRKRKSQLHDFFAAEQASSLRDMFKQLDEAIAAYFEALQARGSA